MNRDPWSTEEEPGTGLSVHMPAEHRLFDRVLDLLERHPSPPVGATVPTDPEDPVEKDAVWFGLNRNRFVYTHHPSHGWDESARFGDTEATLTGIHQHDRTADLLFCVPSLEASRLRSILRQSRGGSVLVTGYRGSGKSSLVNYVVQDLLREEEQARELEDSENPSPSEAPPPGARPPAEADVPEGDPRPNRSSRRRRIHVPIRINVSTSRQAHQIVEIMLRKLHQEATEEGGHLRHISTSCRQRLTQAYERVGEHRRWWRQAGTATESFRPEPGTEARDPSRPEHPGDPYKLHEAQQDLQQCLHLLRHAGYQVIFILDELDKLTPRAGDRAGRSSIEKVHELQQLVADLKFLLTEANAFHIFIAGKGVDESWQEDQNKGEGLFESVFIQNIYLPSLFTVRLEPALGPCEDWVVPRWRHHFELQHPGRRFDPEVRQQWARAFFREIMHELGVPPHAWTYNTGLLVLPHLARNELEQILLRVKARIVRYRGRVPDKSNGDGSSPDRPKDLPWRKALTEEERQRFPWLVPLLDDIAFENERAPHPRAQLAPMPERRTRRLRYLLRYLTFKGRGIPRKVLREFYGLVQHRSVLAERSRRYWLHRGSVEYIVYLPGPVRQKVKFFSNVVGRLENTAREVFRSLDDKVCVATFYIVDYILKFFQTGFRWSDIEYASFMTEREELYPSREMVATLLELFQDFLVERKDRRQRDYMLLPRVRHDLARLYLAFGPEQIELRFTRADFEGEIRRLETLSAEAGSKEPERRLESFKAQVRLGEIFEQLGDHPKALLAYSKGLRWIRSDLKRFLEPTLGGAERELRDGTVVTYASAAIHLLQRLGYLYEQEREFAEALHYYVEAIHLQLTLWRLRGQVKGNVHRFFDRILEQRPYPRNERPRIQRQRLDDPHARLLVNMVPQLRGNLEALTPFLEIRRLLEDNKRMARAYLHLTALEPRRFADSLNLLGVVLEKMWHRYAANRYFLLALNHYQATGDGYNATDQMIFMGEVFLRRRDVRLAASWYLLALRQLTIGQSHTDHIDFTGKLPEHQSSMRAQLFDHLGDLGFATHGTVFVDLERILPMSSEPEDEDEDPGDRIERELREAMKGFRKKLQARVPEWRDEEYFYTMAAAHYTINHQLMRVFDVYVKKLLLRRYKLMEALRRLGQLIPKDSPPDYREITRQVARVVRGWTAFWNGAEKALNALIDEKPGFRGRQPLEMGRVLDRRRLGLLCSQVGTMLTMAAMRPEISDLFEAREPKGESGKNSLHKAFRRAHRGLEGWRRSPGPAQQGTDTPEKHARDHYEERRESIRHRMQGRDRVLREQPPERIVRNLQNELDLERARRSIDRIFARILDDPGLVRPPPGGGHDPEERAPEDPVGLRSPLWGLASTSWTREFARERFEEVYDELGEGFAWMKHPDLLLTGMLEKLAGYLDSSDKKPAADNGPEAPQVAALRRRLRLLHHAEQAHLTAHTMFQDYIGDSDAGHAARGVGLLYLQALRTGLELRAWAPPDPQYCRQEEPHLQRHLALCCGMLQLAARRFLRHALALYAREREHRRCLLPFAGSTHMALGDLQVLQAEMTCRAEEDESAKSALPGLHEPWPELRRIFERQEAHDQDQDVRNIRQQAANSYRRGIEAFMEELENYAKRYRFPHEAYFFHKNICDNKMHFDICHNVRLRHWDYRRNPRRRGEDLAPLLAQGTVRLSRHRFQRQVRVDDRKAWIKDLAELVGTGSRVRPGFSYLQIKLREEKEEEKEEDSAGSFRWKDPITDSEAADGTGNGTQDDRYLRYFFRSFDDGLGRLPDDEENGTEETLFPPWNGDPSRPWKPRMEYWQPPGHPPASRDEPDQGS